MKPIIDILGRRRLRAAHRPAKVTGTVRGSRPAVRDMSGALAP